jgi:uncharacterized membrane protein YccC
VDISLLMAISAESPALGNAGLHWLGALLKEELAPYPGRTAAVARMATACVVTMLAVMIFKLPNGFLAVFYALAISREDPRSTVRNGFAIVLGNLAGLALALAGIILFIDYPLLHFVFLIGTFFLAFFLIRTLANYNMAFGFSIILVAASSVNIIWARPNPLRPDIDITLWTSFGMILGTLAAVLADWMFSPRAAPADLGPRSSRMFVADAFSNPAYQVFALRGCLAATICYVTWLGLGWPGLGVCTVTCVIAAPLSTPGSSRQRLTTRLLGLLTGGVICGIGSQVFILPSVDSIVGFALPFAAVSAAAAWVSTSSPRLSYFGRQMALAYYLTMFQTWGVNATIATSRDRLMGILLGLLAMWLVFDASIGSPRDSIYSAAADPGES